MENDFIHLVSLHFAKRLNKHINKDGLEFLKLVLGIETFIVNVSKLIVVYALSTLLGIFVETLTVHFAFILIKRYSFGLHALNSTICTICSVFMFVLLPYMLTGVEIGNHIVIPMFALIILALYKYAPADTKARPLIGQKNRAAFKRKAVACGVVLLFVALLTPSGYAKTLLTMGAVYQSISILPFTYKILKRSERNYEAYE